MVAVQLSPSIRLRPPTQQQYWTADDLLAHRRFRLSKLAAAVAIASIDPTPAEDLPSSLRLSDPAHVSALLSAVETLKAAGILVHPAEIEANKEMRWAQTLRKAWHRYGWDEAADHYIATYNYPPLDYSDRKQAIATDRARMARYGEADSDIARIKHDYDHIPIEVIVPTPNADMPTKKYGRPVMERAHGSTKILDKDTLLTIISLTLGATDIYHPRNRALPDFFKRSSPSGGCRQPTEGYVLNRGVSDLSTGWFHVSMKPFGLRHLLPLPPETEMAKMFPHVLAKGQRDFQVLIVLTAVFERNMYRYREPRTFRTVFMDAGHIAGSIGMTATALGVSVGLHPADNGTAIEAALGLESLTEGYMITASLGDSAGGGTEQR